MPQHHAQLPSGQGYPCVCGLRPPRKATLREALQTQPVALPVVEPQRERRARAVAEHGDGALQGVVAEGLSTDGGEPSDAFTKIDRRSGSKDTALWGELQHQGVSKKVRTNSASGREESGA